MQDWNGVATVREGRYRGAMVFLRRFGDTARTDYFNVLVLKVTDIGVFLEEMKRDERLRYPFLGLD